MKKLIIPILAGLALSCTNSSAQKQEFKEHISKEFSVSPKSALAVYNINGSIKIEGYEGNKIVMEIDKTISAKTAETLEEGKREFKFQFEQVGDSVWVYTTEPWDSRPNHNRDRWNNDHRRIDYHAKLNFTLKVPNTMNLLISTINDGNIEVENVFGFMKINNINGGIAIKNARNANDIHTINGNVDINYTTLPPNNAKFYTLNGKLTATFPSSLSADCTLKSFNGEFFTDFDNVEKLPSKITKVVKENNGGSTHKLSRGSAVRIGNGNGDRILNFETFNGNIYIKKS